MEFYRINTDREGKETSRTCDLWYKFCMAFTGDYPQDIIKHAKVFKKIAIGDGIFMHHTGLGIVGYGIVAEIWDQEIYKGTDKRLYVDGERDELYEYRIKVDWDIHCDCRKNPLPIKSRLPYRGTYSHIDTKRWNITFVLRDLEIRNLQSQ